MEISSRKKSWTVSLGKSWNQRSRRGGRREASRLQEWSLPPMLPLHPASPGRSWALCLGLWTHRGRQRTMLEGRDARLKDCTTKGTEEQTWHNDSAPTVCNLFSKNSWPTWPRWICGCAVFLNSAHVWGSVWCVQFIHLCPSSHNEASVANQNLVPTLT